MMWLRAPRGYGEAETKRLRKMKLVRKTLLRTE
jgi:hypothetical protein